MSGRHRKPKTSAATVAKIAFAGAVLGCSGLTLAGQAKATSNAEWDQVAHCESGGDWPVCGGPLSGATPRNVPSAAPAPADAPLDNPELNGLAPPPPDAPPPAPVPPLDAPLAVAEVGDWDFAPAPDNQPETWAVHFAESFVGTPYSQASRDDCSGAASQLINVALGHDPRSSFMSTQTAPEWLASRGFVMGDGPPGTLRVGWYNHGSAPNDGHMAITLPDGRHAESGGSHPTFELGGSAAGAEDPEFDHHAYLPVNVMDPEGQANGIPSSE